MERLHNPYRKGTISFDVMEASLQGEFDGLPGIDDLTTEEIAEVLGTNRQAIANAILNIKHKTGYVVKYVKMVGGRKKQKW